MNTSPAGRGGCAGRRGQSSRLRLQALEALRGACLLASKGSLALEPGVLCPRGGELLCSPVAGSRDGSPLGSWQRVCALLLMVAFPLLC